MEFSDSSRDPKRIRVKAADLSTEAGALEHIPNEDEIPPYIFSFRKGLSHNLNGLLTTTADFETFAIGTQDHDPNSFAETVPYRGKFPGASRKGFNDKFDVYRRWESPTSGHAYVLEGPDSYAVTQPQVPRVGSAEFAAEIAEIYQMALCRDWTVAAFMDAQLVAGLRTKDGKPVPATCKKQIESNNTRVTKVAARLSKMRWFSGTADDMQPQALKDRRRHGDTQTPENLFRGVGEDGWATPFLSQFMVMGSGGADRDFEKRADGFIFYGAQRIPQQVRVAIPGQDYMTGWQEYVNVQNALNARPTLPPRGQGAEFVDDAYQPMARLRDLATYVHDDQLYQAYLNAALIMLDERFPLDPGIPYHKTAKRKFPFPGAMLGDTNRTPFALFGPPHLLTLVTEVSSRALKAVRLQKFSVHRRLRPEAAGALFHTVYSGYEPHWDDANSAPYGKTGDVDEMQAREMLGQTVARYTFPQGPTFRCSEPVLEDILTDIRIHNQKQNKDNLKNSWLLPMAFPEGSPMHPAYGAGHATVAGACVTLIKAFFAMRNKDGTPVYLVKPEECALVPGCGAKQPGEQSLELLSVKIEKGLTLEGELNKLMWNISNGRNVAGVHYYTDYIESALLGEAITIGILREQMCAYHPKEQVEMTVPLLIPRTLPPALRNRSTIGASDFVSAVNIRSDGVLEAVDPTPCRT